MLNYSKLFIQGTSVLIVFGAVLTGSSLSAHAGGLNPGTQRSVEGGAPTTSKYIFDREEVSQLARDANAEVNERFGFDGEDPQIKAMDAVTQAEDFVNHIIKKLSLERYEDLVNAAIKTSKGLEGAKVLESYPGRWRIQKPDGAKSWIYAKNLLLDYRLDEVIRVVHQKLKEKYGAVSEGGEILDEIVWPWNTVGGVGQELGFSTVR